VDIELNRRSDKADFPKIVLTVQTTKQVTAYLECGDKAAASL
jgi:hypothetical protein